MTVGISAAFVSDVINLFRGISATAPAAVYLQIHTGDPGAAGTANVSGETSRKILAFPADTGGVSVAAVVSWAIWAAGTETISDVSVWDAPAAGNFKMSGTLNSPKLVENGDTLNITPTLAYAPVAA